MSLKKSDQDNAEAEADDKGIKNDKHRILLGKIDTFLDKVSTWGSGIGTLVALGLWFWTYAHWVVVVMLPFITLWVLRKVKLSLSWQITGVVLVTILFGLLAFNKPIPEPKPYPHLTFSLQADIDPENFIELTNSLLVVSNFGNNPLSPMVLFVPHHQDREATVLQFIVENNGPIDTENLEVCVGISDEFSGVAGPEWGPTSPVSIVAINTNKYVLASWGFRVPPIHPGNGFRLPLIQIKKPPIIDLRNPQKPVMGSFAIMARAKESPAQAINGFLCFVPYFTNAFFKPFVLQWKNQSNGAFNVDFDLTTNGGLIR